MTKRLLTFLTLLTLFFGVGWAAEVTDVLDRAFTGATNSTYITWSGKTATSNAVYAGSSAGGNNSIQLRDYSNSGIITTASGGKVKSITVTWNSNTSNGRKLVIYGKHTAYTATSQLYNTSNQGDRLGYIYYMDSSEGTTTSLTVSGDYEYIGLRSVSGAMYLTDITIVWEDGSTPTAAAPTFSPAGGTYYEPLSVTLSSTTEGATIRYTTDGTDPTATTGTVYTGPISVSSTTTIKAIATATGYDPSSVASATYEIFTPNTVTPLYEETFAGTFGYFYKKDVTGTNIWVTNSGYAKASGYIGGSATDSEGWLVSPYIDLTNAVAPKLSFSHAGNYFNNATTMQSDVKVMIKKQSDTQWSELTIDTWPDGNSWTFADNTTSLASYAGEIIQIAFKYTSTTSRAGTWEIKNLIVEDASAPKYYLYGTFNGWNTQDADYEFNLSNGTYSITGVDLPDNVRFKIAKVVDGQVTEYGASNGGNDYGINGEWHTNIPMNGADAYYIASGALTNITLNTTNMTFDVSRDAQFFVKGDFNGWNREAMTATATGWTIEHVISKANQFGFVDEWGYWYGGRDWWINEEHLDTRLEIKPDGNFYMNIDGTDDYTLTVNSAKDTLTVTKIVVVPSNDYVLVTDVDDLDVSSSFIIVSKEDGIAMAGQRSQNNRAGKAVTLKENGIKAVPDEDIIELFSLEAGTGGWYFKATNISPGYLYAYSSGSNQLQTKNQIDGNGNSLATISIDANSGVASIKFQGTNTRNTLQFNLNNNNPPLFSCYSSASQSPVYLYKKVEVEERATPPVITPASQNVKGGLLEGVMITAAEGATIHYTLDGSEPTVDSPVFEGQAFNVTGTGGERKMVRAIAVEAGKAPSYPASVTYTFQAPATPIISPEAGTFETPVNVTISSTDGGTIYYLVDPEEAPTNAAAVIDGNQVYTEGETEIILSENGTHKVYAAVDLNGITSWAQATYTINLPVTLAELVENGNTEIDYTISDELVAVKCVEVGNDAYLWCKDQGNASIVKTENPDPENIVDYMKANHFFNGNWDQSNWIALIFKNVSPDDMMAIKGYEGKRISQGTLKGKYISRENYAMQMNTTTLTTLDGAAYSPNVYCAANFLYRNQNGNATGHEPDGTPTDEHYFFVNPKVQEFCDITFAVWHPESDYYDGYFTLPAPDSTNNTANIYGAFKVDWTLNAPCGDVSEYLSANPGEAYRFKAIVHQQIKKSSSDLRENTHVTPQSGVRPEGGYVVYPVGFDPTNEANIVTRIENVAVDGTGKTVAGVKYYNLAGIESNRPFEGVNIVVTTYTDGSRSSSKVLK